MFVQIVAHIPAASVPHSVLQYLKAGQIIALAKPTSGHRPLLMMSFLRRLALKSIMSLVEPCCSALNKTTRTLQPSFPNGTQVPQEHRMHCNSAYTKISANSGVDQGCLLSTSGISAAIDPTLRSLLADVCRLWSGAKLLAFLDDWHVWIKPQHFVKLHSTIVHTRVPFSQHNTLSQRGCVGTCATL